MDVKKRVGCDVVVIGGGNAGLTAAIEARNAGKNVLDFFWDNIYRVVGESLEFYWNSW